MLPTFVASEFSSMSPFAFNPFAPVLIALIDEIAFLKAEVSEHRKAAQRNVCSIEHVVMIKQDVDNFDKLTHELRNHTGMFSYNCWRCVWRGT